jgi:hypothetical protein
VIELLDGRVLADSGADSRADSSADSSVDGIADRNGASSTGSEAPAWP